MALQYVFPSMSWNENITHALQLYKLKCVTLLTDVQQN